MAAKANLPVLLARIVAHGLACAASLGVSRYWFGGAEGVVFAVFLLFAVAIEFLPQAVHCGVRAWWLVLCLFAVLVSGMAMVHTVSETAWAASAPVLGSHR